MPTIDELPSASQPVSASDELLISQLIGSAYVTAKTTVGAVLAVLAGLGLAPVGFLSGEGVPSNSLGADGWTYLNASNGDVYQRASGTWTKIGSIEGAQGVQGIQGAPGVIPGTDISLGLVTPSDASQTTLAAAISARALTSSLGSIASQNAGTVAIGGGTADNIIIGGTTAAAGHFTTGSFSGNVTQTGTGSLKIASGTTAQRPDSGAAGELRYSTSLPGYEAGSGSAWVPVPHGVARAATIAALRSIDVSGFGSANCIAMVDGYSFAGDGGGGTFDWVAASTYNDDGVVVFRPTAISSGNPGRWIRRLPDGVLTPEMAGAVGDYVFPIGSSTESGTENSAAFNRLFVAVGFYVPGSSNADGLNGATIQMPSGKQYLIAGNVTMVTGACLEGTGSSIGGPLSGPPFTSIFSDGGVLVIDPGYTFSVNAKCRLANMHILRRGMNMNPTTAQVTSFWSSVSADTSVGINVTQGWLTLDNVTVVGFNTGIKATAAGIGAIRNCALENWNCIEVSGAGDTHILDNIHCTPLYHPTADTPPNADWQRKGGVAIYLHDRMDTAIVKDCEAELWAVGIKLSNVWGVNVTRCRVETYTNNPDVCYQLRNVCSYVEFNECYAGGVICYDIGATDYAKASSPPTYSGHQTQSEVLIRGGQVGGLVASAYTGAGSSTPFIISGNAAGTIADVHVNRQGTTVFTFSPTDGDAMFWNIADIRIDEDTAPATLASIASIDSSAAAGVHFNAIWASQQNRWIVPPGHDDSVDLVSSPASAGSHTIADGVSWCHLTPSGTLASYTVTMPAHPVDKMELVVSSSATITALTLSPNSGQTMPLAPTALTAHGDLRFRYLAASTAWMWLVAQPTFGIQNLATVASVGGSDLVAIGQSGSTVAVPVSTLIAGETIDQLGAATPAADADTFASGQGSNVLARQTLGAVWNLMASHLPGYHRPVVELTTNTTLDGSVHNNAILICSAAITLSPSGTMGSGFACDVVNVSGSDVTLGAGITTSNAGTTIPTGESARILRASYSGGNLVFAMLSAGSGGSAPVAPGTVTSLAASSESAASVSLTWSTPSSGGQVTSYAVNYRLHGAGSWSGAPGSPISPATSYTVTGLSASTAYDFQVIAQNSAGTGTPAELDNISTASATAAPGAPTSVTTSGATASSMTVNWGPPSSGGTVSGYSVNYAVHPESSWTLATGSLSSSATSYTVTGLAASTSYDFQVVANSTSSGSTASATVTASTTAAGPSYLLTAGEYPTSGSTWAAGTTGIPVNANDNSTSIDGSYTIPTMVYFGWSLSNSTQPASLTAAAGTSQSIPGETGHNIWYQWINGPSVIGSYYFWAVAKNSGGSVVATYVSPSTFAFT